MPTEPYGIYNSDEVNYIKWLTLRNCSPVIKLDCLYIEGKLDMVQNKQKMLYFAKLINGKEQVYLVLLYIKKTKSYRKLLGFFFFFWCQSK